jgi:dihydrofolate synthase / folylpolyglutamate synthase
MLYQEFLETIYRKYSGNVRLELDRMRNLLAAMGNPQNSLRGLHIAGTNGKGSVCATLEALSLAHGFRTGLNTSPHLIDYTERFRIEGNDLPFQRVLDVFHRYEEEFERWDASFFEITTAIAFQIFKDENLHTAIIEVGLGGRLDATNIFTPDICAITTIGLDHVKTLGGTLELIAAEKAGIIKPGIPLVLGRIDESPLKVITAKAEEMSAPVYIYGRDFKTRIRKADVSGVKFDYSFGGYSFNTLHTNLLGEHQCVNLAVALTSFLLYLEKRGLPCDEQAIHEALQQINWMGRMQVLSTAPVIIIDGAHNVQGVNALLLSLQKIFPDRKFSFLLSILADKNFGEMLKLFAPVADKVWIAQNQSDRAASVEEQAEILQECGVAWESATSVGEAFRLAKAELKPDDILICGGSLYTVGEVLTEYNTES